MTLMRLILGLLLLGIVSTATPAIAAKNVLSDNQLQRCVDNRIQHREIDRDIKRRKKQLKKDRRYYRSQAGQIGSSYLLQGINEQIDVINSQIGAIKKVSRYFNRYCTKPTVTHSQVKRYCRSRDARRTGYCKALINIFE